MSCPTQQTQAVSLQTALRTCSLYPCYSVSPYFADPPCGPVCTLSM